MRPHLEDAKTSVYFGGITDIGQELRAIIEW